MSINLFDTLQAVGLPAPRGILQIGASYAQELKDFLERGVRCGVLVEPLPEPYGHIAALCKQLPGFVAFNALCTDTAGEKHTFHVASNGGQSGSIMKPTGHLKMFDFVKFDNTVELVSTTADDIMAFLAAKGHGAVTQGLDTLYMDVQGAEFKVLLGAPRTLKQMNYIFMEIIRGDLYAGAVPLASYIALLDAQGFTLNNINFNPQHHADAVFVRKSLVGLA